MVQDKTVIWVAVGALIFLDSVALASGGIGRMCKNGG